MYLIKHLLRPRPASVQSIAMSVSICRISQKLHPKLHEGFLYMLTRPSSGDNAIRYVRPVS